MKLKNISLLLTFSVLSGGCKSMQKPGQIESRIGDEIMVAGNMFHTGTKVVLWMDPGGYDAYRVERRFAPYAKSDWTNSSEESSELRSPARYGLRQINLSPEEIERVRGGSWDLPLLQREVDQFVIHFDVCGVSRQCFKVLHDSRDLSVHFMLDIDGTIYQTLDLKEKAYQATIANNRSIGIEIANIGSYTDAEKDPLDKWYHTGKNGMTTLTIPKSLGNGGVRTHGFIGHPAKPGLIRGTIQNHNLHQYDFTPQQYSALARLTATLCTVFPKIECKYPVDASGKLITHKLPDNELDNYHGVLGHYHIQSNKVDPGPAFNWDYVIGNARQWMNK
jgi:N-acetyl-anhydromuramyl-L-alanine amidase AmpD